MSNNRSLIMRHGFPRLLQTAAICSVLSLVGLSTIAGSQEQVTQLSQVQTYTANSLDSSEVINIVAEYTNGNPDDIKRMLIALGLESSLLPSDFNTLSPIQQVKWGYASVEKAQQGAGAGAEFLSALISHASNSIPSIKDESKLQSFISRYPISHSKFSFATGVPPVIDTSRDPAIDEVIALISDVIAGRGAPISAREVLEHKLGLTEDDVVNAIIEHGSGHDALVARLQALSDPPQKEKLAEIALQIFNNVPAARSDKVLNEAIFRWIGLDDPKYGEWFKYREKLIELVEAGKLNESQEKIATARETVKAMREAFSQMPRLYAAKNLPITPTAVERMFYAYTKYSPQTAALWGFAVIGLKPDFDRERYLEGNAASMKRTVFQEMTDDAIAKISKKMNRPLTAMERLQVKDEISKQYDDAVDWTAKAREHGAYPHNGYVEYVRLTGFGDPKEADKYFSSPSVSEAVNGVCPN
ncbi:hypothetical protein [Paraburkholderia hospita]|uniref:hypothetical protein n=1 Tax=Paraburkholderia hospita TaxID=169430 RepID=UPI003ECFFDAD